MGEEGRERCRLDEAPAFEEDAWFTVKRPDDCGGACATAPSRDCIPSVFPAACGVFGSGAFNLLGVAGAWRGDELTDECGDCES